MTHGRCEFYNLETLKKIEIVHIFVDLESFMAWKVYWKLFCRTKNVFGIRALRYIGANGALLQSANVFFSIIGANLGAKIGAWIGANLGAKSANGALLQSANVFSDHWYPFSRMVTCSQVPFHFLWHLFCDTCEGHTVPNLCRHATGMITNRFQSIPDDFGHFWGMLHFCDIVTSQVWQLSQRPKTCHRHAQSLYL